MTMLNDFRVKVKLSGVNLNRIYKECASKNIKLFNIDRKDYKNIVFDVEKKNIPILKEIAKVQNFEFEIMKTYGFVKVISFLSKRIGLCIGAIAFLFLIIFNSFFIWNIKIYGLENISSGEIISVLNQCGIKSGTMFFGADFEDIEEKLLDNVEDISLCSIIKKGSTIIVNIKEKLSSDELTDSTNQTDIVANQNMTIKSISVVQGTAQKKVGDSVKKGEVIVAGYFVDTSGNSVPCKANAQITATVWFTETETYQKQKEVLTKTGKKIVSSHLEFLGMNFAVKNNQNTFECFEEETTTSQIFKNNLLPFNLVTTTYYEATKEIVSQNFSAEKDTIIQNLEQKAIQKVPVNLVVSKTFSTVVENENDFVITSYAEVDIEL
jgi:sporulation protein YqfD